MQAAPLSFPAILMFILGITLLAAGAICMMFLCDRANAALPEAERIPRYARRSWSSFIFLLRTHRESFPESKLAPIGMALVAMGLASVAAAVVLR